MSGIPNERPTSDLSVGTRMSSVLITTRVEAILMNQNAGKNKVILKLQSVNFEIDIVKKNFVLLHGHQTL
jgi:hypothetical protein